MAMLQRSGLVAPSLWVRRGPAGASALRGYNTAAASSSIRGRHSASSSTRHTVAARDQKSGPSTALHIPSPKSLISRPYSTANPKMYTASFAFFEAIWEAGITHCFVNLGSDHPSIIEAMVKGQREAKGKFPTIITCPNEVCLALQT